MFVFGGEEAGVLWEYVVSGEQGLSCEEEKEGWDRRGLGIMIEGAALASSDEVGS